MHQLSKEVFYVSMSRSLRASMVEVKDMESSEDDFLSPNNAKSVDTEHP